MSDRQSSHDMSRGFTVSQRAKTVKQPRGGYVKPRDFTVHQLGEGIEQLHPDENVPAILMGIAVDYMTRFMSGEEKEEAFKISLMGASIIFEADEAQDLLSYIKGLDDTSLDCALKLCGYDVIYRKGSIHYRPDIEIEPDVETLENFRILVSRSLDFLKEFGPVVLSGFKLDGAYTDIIRKGDGDYLTTDTLWDFKVSKGKLDKNQTMQLMIYWRMGLRTAHPEFQRIKYLGIYNPRKNEASRIAIADIPNDIIKIVDREVIGYPD